MCSCNLRPPVEIRTEVMGKDWAEDDDYIPGHTDGDDEPAVEEGGGGQSGEGSYCSVQHGLSSIYPVLLAALVCLLFALVLVLAVRSWYSSLPASSSSSLSSYQCTAATQTRPPAHGPHSWTPPLLAEQRTTVSRAKRKCTSSTSVSTDSLMEVKHSNDSKVLKC